MKNSIIVLIFLSILSCSDINRNIIPLFNGITFEMNEGEEMGVITSSVKEIYAENFNNSEIQIPLFRYIKHSNYQIFIGIPYNTSINELTQNQLRKQEDLISNLKGDSLYFYDRYKRGDFYMTEYAAMFSNNSLIYISTISPSKELTDSLFIQSELLSRINTNNK